MTIGSLVALAVAFAATVGGAAPGSTAPSAPRPRAAPSVEKPAFHHRFIPIDDGRRRETSAYAQRHYGLRGSTIAAPHVIVEHLTVNDSVDATFNTFAPDVPDVELHELPGLCSQFVIARSGAIYQFTPIEFMCRHTVGLNWTAIGIEHVAYREDDVFARRAQLDASLRLTRWLRCRYRIPVGDVIGHAESLSSPYHHELVPSLRRQTHSDWRHASMQTYRHRLRRLGPCPDN